MANEKRLIWDEDAKRHLIALATGHHSETLHIDMILNAILHHTTTVDAVEVVHGEWEKYADDRFMGYGADGRIRYRKVYSYKCSKCWNYTAVKHKYCPNCGAKMDGERKDNDF